MEIMYTFYESAPLKIKMNKHCNRICISIQCWRSVLLLRKESKKRSQDKHNSRLCTFSGIIQASLMKFFVRNVSNWYEYITTGIAWIALHLRLKHTKKCLKFICIKSSLICDGLLVEYAHIICEIYMRHTHNALLTKK